MPPKVKAKMVDAYYDDVNRMLAELDKLKKAPKTDTKAQDRIAQIRKAFSDAEVENLFEKAKAYDARELKKILKTF